MPDDHGRKGRPAGPEFETLMMELSARFINLPADRVDAAIEAAQHQVCDLFGLERATLWQFDKEKPGRLIMTHAYHVPGGTSLPSQPDGHALFPWLVSRLLAGQSLALSSLADLPAEAAQDRTNLQKFNTKATLMIPLASGGQAPFGVMTFAIETAERIWTESEIKRFGLVAQIFANAIVRRQADAARRTSEERMWRAMLAGNTGAWVLNREETRFLTGGQTLELLGLPPGDGVDVERFLNLLHPEDLPRMRETMASAMHSREMHSIEYRIVRPDGQIRWLLSRGCLVANESGGPDWFTGVIADITERKQIEETLQKQNRYIETILEEAPIGFAVLSREDGRALFVSARFEEIYGVPRGTLDSQQAFFDKVWPNHPELREEIRRRVGADMNSGDVRRMRWENVPIPLPSGETRHVTAVNILVPEQNLVVATVWDVTEQVRAKAALQESKTQIAAVINSTDDFVWSVDPERFGLLTFNQALKNYFFKGLHVDIQVGMTPADLLPPEFAAKWPKMYARALREGAFVAEYDVAAGTNTLLLSIQPMVRDGKVFGISVFGKDITERKRSEEALRQALEEVRTLRDRLQQENVYLREQLHRETGPGAIVGESEPVLRMLALARKVAPTNSAVLITGETGTGKELLAQAIHDLSARKGKTMVKVNCAALPAPLIESELFGREKGAYTGAMTQQVGRFELADGSTVFLDEIGDLPLDLQVKLLRVLQDGQYERLGSTRTLKTDARLIAATNRDLAAMVKAGTFREDLFHRLNVFPIEVPPLRVRCTDIPLLVWKFVQEFNTKMGRTIESISKPTMEKLQQYPWPGNVRELRNLIERAIIVSEGPTLQIELPAAGLGTELQLATLEEHERKHILEVLERTRWRISGKGGAAEILGLVPTTLHSRMKKLGISRPKAG